jgi:outer membrane protein, heavy metal efflux system
MKSLTTRSILEAAFLILPVSLIGQTAPHQNSADHAARQAEKRHQEMPAVVLRLDDLERMALENNPTLKQAEARTGAAQGRLRQAGLYPNPAIGYAADEISFGPIIRGGEHGFFVDQTIVLGGKLGKNRQVFAQALAQAEAEAETQRHRVLNNVRLLYYEALGAQRRLEMRQKLAGLAEEAVKTSLGLFNVGASDKPDLLEIEVEAQEARLAVTRAQNEQLRIWQQLAALLGVLDLRVTPLAGDFDQGIPVLEPDTTLQEILRDSPLLKSARAGVQRAQASVDFERSLRIPDLQARGGLRYNRELLERGGLPVGWEGFADVGIQIPLFNRNQGTILAARSEASFAEQEVRRLEMVIRSRFSSFFNRYQTLRQMVETYKNEIIPRADQAYQLYLAKFKEMAAAYPQALIAQRTLFQAGIEYVSAVENLWRAVVPLQGYLLTEGLDAPRAFEDRVSVEQSLRPDDNFPASELEESTRGNRK